MKAVHGFETKVRLIEGKTIHITSGVPESDISGVDISRYCRKAIVTMDVADINQAMIEIVGPAIDVIAELKEVRVMVICDHCKEEIKTKDVTAFQDRARKVEAA